MNPCDKAATPAQVEALLADHDLSALKRLYECLEDGEGFDVSKKRMARLLELGFARHNGFGRYSITAIGQYLLGAWTKVPLQTHADVNAAYRAEMEARNG